MPRDRNRPDRDGAHQDPEGRVVTAFRADLETKAAAAAAAAGGVGTRWAAARYGRFRNAFFHAPPRHLFPASPCGGGNACGGVEQAGRISLDAHWSRIPGSSGILSFLFRCGSGDGGPVDGGLGLGAVCGA